MIGHLLSPEGTSKGKSQPVQEQKGAAREAEAEPAPAVVPKRCSNTTKTNAPRPSVSGRRLAPANQEA
jgi:hypothetical protein